MLKAFAEEMQAIGIPYEFMRWTANVQYPYFIGEYSEMATNREDGYKESTILVTGTTDGSWAELEQMKQKIESHFPTVCGLRKSTDSGAVAFYYENAFPVETGDARLKRIQINIRAQEWKGMI